MKKRCFLFPNCLNVQKQEIKKIFKAQKSNIDSSDLHIQLILVSLTQSLTTQNLLKSSSISNSLNYVS